MAVKTIADLIVEAHNTGQEAKFEDGGQTYDFSPSGLKDYIAGSSSDVSWSSITGKPTTFAPAAHTHATADITGVNLAAFKTAVDALVSGTSTLEDVIAALQNI